MSCLEKGKAAVICRPDVFAAGIGMTLYPRQAEVLRALEKPGARVALKACNESGKTSRIITAAILWHLTMYPRGVVKSTSGSWHQITTQLVPKLKSFAHKFPAWKFHEQEVENGLGGYWWGISTNDAGRFEGAHADEDAPLLIIVDEAKTVPDAIFQAIERCRPTRLLLASSTGATEGEFYHAFGRNAPYYTSLFTITVDDCPHISREHVERTTAKWGGRDSDLIKSMFWAEFMTKSDDLVVNMAALERLLANPPMEQRKPECKGFCDFAAGGDENVFAVRRGNRVVIEDAWRERDTMAAVGRFILNFKRAGLEPWEIEGDADGLGKPMCDALAEAGWPITPFHGGQEPRFDEHYANLSAETWYEGAREIEQGTVILPADGELRGQLLSRRRRYNSKGKLGVEPKEEMRRRGLPSPDRADAVLGAMRPLLAAKSVTLAGHQYQSIFTDEGEMATAEAGGWRGGFDPGG